MALTKADLNKISDMIKMTVMAVVSEAIKTIIQNNSINLKQKPINYREKTIKKLEAYNILKHNMEKCEKDIEDLFKEEFGACPAVHHAMEYYGEKCTLDEIRHAKKIKNRTYLL